MKLFVVVMDDLSLVIIKQPNYETHATESNKKEFKNITLRDLPFRRYTKLFEKKKNSSKNVISDSVNCTS